VLSNLVNYKSFGFTKFIPRLPEDKFLAVVAGSAQAPSALVLWSQVSEYVYDDGAIAEFRL
jgi:dipeptidyl-peptidase-3